jgi:hypothetical protein
VRLLAGEYAMGAPRGRFLLQKIKKEAGHFSQPLHLTGGEIGIRTLGTASGTTDFESAAFDLSAISPYVLRI